MDESAQNGGEEVRKLGSVPVSILDVLSVAVSKEVV